MGKGLGRISPHVTRLAVLVHIGWLVIVAASLWINQHYSRHELEQSALAGARAIYQRDTAFRFWVAEFGGVYAPVNAKTPPNPYLVQRPDRDQHKRDGTPLTLVNPAYMQRLVNESNANNVAKGEPSTHITSLKPLRPENGPDAWERAALERVERERSPEIYEFTTINDQPYLRYLHPTWAEAGCLKCHAAQGYRRGDLRGGLVVSLPLAGLLAAQQSTLLTLYAWHLLIYLAGVALLLWGQRLVCRRVRERDLALAALEESEGNFRTVADFAYAWEYWLGPDGEMRYVSPSVAELTGYGVDRFMADPGFLLSIIAPEDRETLQGHLAVELQQVCGAIDFRIRTATGEIRWLHHICRPVYDRHGVFQGRRASNYDITEEKTVKLRNEELISKLREALDKVKTLSGFLPICASCKKIRDDRGYWDQIESYIAKHSEAVFSHGLCPECAHRLYPDIFPPRSNNGEEIGPTAAAQSAALAPPSREGGTG